MVKCLGIKYNLVPKESKWEVWEKYYVSISVFFLVDNEVGIETKTEIKTWFG